MDVVTRYARFIVLIVVGTLALLVADAHRWRTASAVAQPAYDIQAGHKLYSANCANCHGANGEGGFGPSLQQIGSRLSFQQTVDFIEHPVGPMPKLYPETLSDRQVHDVAAYVRQTFHSGSTSGRSGPYGGGYGMGPGMMYGYGPGGYGPGMMYDPGYGPGMMYGPRYGPAYPRASSNLNLSVADVRKYFERWLVAEGNSHVKLGSVNIKDANTIILEIVTTKGNSLVERYTVDRHTGYIAPER